MAMPDAVGALLTLEAASLDRLSRQVYNVGGFNASARDLHDVVRRAFAMTQVWFRPDPKRQAIVDSWPEDVDTTAASRDWVSTGVTGERGARNAPTVYNAAGHIAQFWDGRAADVEEQATGPILNPIEMGMTSPDQVMARLAALPGYPDAFAAAFPDDPNPFTFNNVGNAIGAFERQLLTPGRWDRYLAGDAAALSADEKHGLKEFLNTGCQGCHNGPSSRRPWMRFTNRSPDLQPPFPGRSPSWVALPPSGGYPCGGVDTRRSRWP